MRLEKKIFKFRQCIFAIPLEKGGALYLNKLEYSLLTDALCRVWLKLAQWFWRRSLNFVIVFSLFRYYLLLGKGLALHLNNLESPTPKNALCQVWLALTQWFWRGIFLISSMYFCYFIIISVKLKKHRFMSLNSATDF